MQNGPKGFFCSVSFLPKSYRTCLGADRPVNYAIYMLIPLLDVMEAERTCTVLEFIVDCHLNKTDMDFVERKSRQGQG